MKHIIEKHAETPYRSNILDFYFNDLKWAALDIETTGLNPSRNKFILGGLFDVDSAETHQFFAENRTEEKKALTAYMEQVSHFDMVLTYNGKHFDMPFLERRMKVHGLQARMPYNLDLYLVLNGHSPIKRFVPNLKQKTVENYMGLWQTRTDEISGKESVEMYNTYETTGDYSLGEKILLHNNDDVLQLSRLLKIISKCDFHKAMYHLGFPAGRIVDCSTGNKIAPLTINKIRIDGNFLVLSGVQRVSSIDYIGFSVDDYPAEVRFDSKTASFSMKLPVIRDCGLLIADIDLAGADPAAFEKYPTYSSGFLVLEDRDKRNYMEINHFIMNFINRFIRKELENGFYR